MATADPGSMGRFALASAFALLLSGCLEVEQTVTFEKDGSGSQTLVMTAPEATLSAVRMAATVNQTNASSDPTALFTKEKVETELAAAGLVLARHETSEVGSARKVDMQADFSAPSQLRQSPLIGSLAEWQFAKGPVPDTFEVTLFPQGKKAWEEARAKAEAMKDKVDAVASDFFARRKQQLEGLDVTFRLRLPGKVLRYTANLEQTGECEVTAKITAEQIKTPEDLVRRLAPRFQAVFDARECKTFPIDG
jgi:hypothetical protein